MMTQAEIEAVIIAINDEIAKVQRGEVYATERALTYLEGVQHGLQGAIGQEQMPDPSFFTTANPADGV